MIPINTCRAWPCVPLVIFRLRVCIGHVIALLHFWPFRHTTLRHATSHRSIGTVVACEPPTPRNPNLLTCTIADDGHERGRHRGNARVHGNGMERWGKGQRYAEGAALKRKRTLVRDCRAAVVGASWSDLR